METGSLYIEAIQGKDKHFFPFGENESTGMDEFFQGLPKKFNSGNLYPIPSTNNRTSRRWWLANDKKKGVRVVFRPEENGLLSVWNFPEEEEQFVIGAIGAIDAENKYSIVTVLNSRTLNQSVELAAKLSPDLFAIEIFKLSVWLNCARIGFERSAKRHGLTLQQVLIAGNPQHDVIGYGSLLHLDISLDKVIGEFINKYGFELKEDNKSLFFDNLLAAIREEKIKLNSEKLVNELKAPTLLGEGDKADWTNRAYAMAICYEMARLYPYRKPRSGQEFAKSDYDPFG